MRQCDVSVLTSGHDVADARLHREVRALVRAGLRVEVRGLGDREAGPSGAEVLTHPRGGRGLRLRDAALLPWQARGRVLLCLDPDLLPSATARRLTGRRVVADVHEDYLALLADRDWARGAAGRVARAVARSATWLAARADLTVVADEHVPPLGARERLVVRNLPDLSLLPPPGPPDAVPRAVYVGDLRASRGLFTMLEAVEQAPAWTLDLVGPVAAADEPAVQRWVAGSAASSRVRFHGRLPPERAWEVAAGAWVGLSLLDTTPAFAAATPSKLYEYLACGMAVLASPLPRTRALLDRTGAGAFASSSGEAAALLRQWSDEPGRVLELRRAAVGWAAAQATASPYAGLADRVRRLATASAVQDPESG